MSSLTLLSELNDSKLTCQAVNLGPEQQTFLLLYIYEMLFLYL